MKRFAIRKIRKGRVKINGRWFRPDEHFMKYDGRLDNMWYVFGCYPDPSPRDFLWFVSLWGTIEMYKDIDAGYGPELIDSHFPWTWWNEVKNG